MRKLFKNLNKNHSQQQQEKELNSRYLINQIKKISIILFFLGAVVCIQITSIVYALSVTTDNTTTILQAPSPQNPDIISYLFNNSLTSMLLSTFIIAIIGVLINKLRTFKKKLDMIEILTKSHVKMKQQADEREKRFEKRYIESQNNVSQQINQLCSKLDSNKQELEEKIDRQSNHFESKLDRQSEELDKKIDSVKDDATKTLIDYLRSNSLSRKR